MLSPEKIDFIHYYFRKSSGDRACLLELVSNRIELSRIFRCVNGITLGLRFQGDHVTRDRPIFRGLSNNGR